jgi:chromosome segregation ATPase
MALTLELYLIKRIKEEINELKTESGEYDYEISGLKVQLGYLETKIELNSLKGRLEEAEEHRCELDMMRHDLTNEVETLREQIEELKNINSELQDEINTMNAEK